MKKLLVFCFFSLILNISICSARDNGIYSADVYVDVTADNASIARERAMTQANRTGFGTVVRRITTEEGVKTLSSLDDAQILNFIKEVYIKSEKASNVRYMANLKVVVNDDILKQYMEEKGIQPAVITASNVLVIPTFREFKSDTPMLWEAANIWRNAWDEAVSTNDIVAFTSIPTNGSNYASLDAKKALSLDGVAMDQISFNNNTRDIFVVDAVYNGIEGLSITIYSLQDGSVETIEVYGERSPDLLNNAIAETKKYIENKLKKQSIADSSQKSQVLVLYNYNNMIEWVKVETSLKEIKQIDDIVVDAMGNGKVQFKINFSGQIYRLIDVLQENNLILKDQGSFYLLEKAKG